MAATAQECLANAAASRAGDFEGAAKAYLDAAGLHVQIDERQQSATATLCAVTAHIEGGNLEEAGFILKGLEAKVAGLPGIEDHTHHGISAKKLQLKTLLSESLPPTGPVSTVESFPDYPGRANLVPRVVTDGPAMANQLIEKLEEVPHGIGKLAELCEEHGTKIVYVPPLTPQDILDRAKGVGINASINDAGHVEFREPFTTKDGEKWDDAAGEWFKVVKETLETVGLTAIGTDADTEKVWGDIVEATPLPV